MEPKRFPTRGFGSMSVEKRREIASKGGKRAHEFTTEEARRFGAIGGSMRQKNDRQRRAQEESNRG